MCSNKHSGRGTVDGYAAASLGRFFFSPGVSHFRNASCLKNQSTLHTASAAMRISTSRNVASCYAKHSRNLSKSQGPNLSKPCIATTCLKCADGANISLAKTLCNLDWALPCNLVQSLLLDPTQAWLQKPFLASSAFAMRTAPAMHPQL